ncbi:MAG: PAS domain S-box protein, partial [Candidatus Latescibacteria bacterium]|nr:PAS domain S-box protein [Candidatus Latescibacterota bacterium]
MDEVSIMLPTPDGQELYVAAVRGTQREYLLGQRMSIEQGVAGWVARHRETLQLHGEVIDPRFTLIAPRPEIQFALSLPMLVGGKLVGVLNMNTTHRHLFTLGQMKALSILTGMAAATLENVRLYTQVQEAEAKYHAIVEHAVEGIFQTTPDGRFITANPALARMHGYASPEEMITSITDVGQQLYVDPHHRTEFMRLIEEQGSVSQFEAQVYRKDGSVIWISENTRAVRDASGTLLYYEGTL